MEVPFNWIVVKPLLAPPSHPGDEQQNHAMQVSPPINALTQSEAPDKERDSLAVT